jgi:hypothetical protein
MKLFGISNGTVQAIKDRNRRCRLQFALHPRCDSTTQNDDLGTVFMDGFVDQLAEGRDCSIDVRMCAYTRQLSGLAIFLDKGSDGGNPVSFAPVRGHVQGTGPIGKLVAGAFVARQYSVG